MNYDAYINALRPVTQRVRTDATAIKGPKGVSWTREALTDLRLRHHLNGGPARGVCPIKAGESVTMLALLDLDSHKGEVAWEHMAVVASTVSQKLAERGLRVNPWRSSGGNGMHLIMLWDEPQDAYSVRQELIEALAECGFRNGTGGVAKREIEVFPKQDSVPADGYGNQFILPLAGKSVPLELLLGFEPMDRELAPSVQWLTSEPVAVREKPAPGERSAVLYDETLAERALAAIPNDIDNRDEWFRLMCAAKEAGVDKEAARAWTMQHGSWKSDAEFDGPWDSIKLGREEGTPAEYLFTVAEQHGFHEHLLAELEDVPDLKAVEREAKRQRFTPIKMAEFARRPPPTWVIKGILPRAGLVVLFGESGSGKSFMALDMAAAIARGVEWRGHRVKQGRVVYIAAEGAGGFRNRCVAYAQAHGVEFEALGVEVIADRPNLLKNEDAPAIAQAIGQADVIVIDTFAQVTPGANENAGEDMGAALDRCAAIHRATGAVIVLVHHSGKDTSKGARGWSGIRAAADAELEVVKGAGGRYMRTTKQKDGDDTGEWGFALEVVTIGVDEDGDEITSCVVREAQVNKAKMTTKKLGPREKAIVDAFQAIAESQVEGIEVEGLLDEAVARIDLEGKRASQVKGNLRQTLRRMLENAEFGIGKADDGTLFVR